MSDRKLKLLVISQVYKPSHDATSQLLTDLTQDLAAHDMEVHVLTPAINYMSGDRLPLVEYIDSVKIWRTPAVMFGKGSYFQRLLSFSSFHLLVWPGLLFLPTPDIVLYFSSPPLIGISSRFARWTLRAKTLFIAQDVYPEVAIRMGYINSSIITWILAMIDRYICRHFDHIVVLSERMRREYLAKGVNPEQISIIPNWSAEDTLIPLNRDNNPLLIKLGLSDKFVVQYSGNMGVVHDIEGIIDGARQLSGDKDVVFLMIGEGKKRATVERARQKYRLENVILLPYQPRDQLQFSLTAADIALVSQMPASEGLVFPSKLYGVLAAGLPVLFLGDREGEIAHLITQCGCGLVARDGNELAEVISCLKGDRDLLCDMGHRSRALFEKRYRKQMSVEKYNRLVRSIVKGT